MSEQVDWRCTQLPLEESGLLGPLNLEFLQKQ